MKTQKNAKKSITRTLMVGATCMALVGLWAVLVVPGTALANKPDENGDHNHGGGNGGTGDVGGDVSGVIYCEVEIYGGGGKNTRRRVVHRGQRGHAIDIAVPTRRCRLGPRSRCLRWEYLIQIQ